jgi:hypothetical protein
MSPTGHIAIGFATKNFAPKIPLPIIIIAAYALDLIHLILVAAKIEETGYAPWSHSLIMALLWSAVALFITKIFTGNYKAGIVMGLILFSHWVLDFIVWNDMLVTFDKNIRIGVGIYNAIGFSQTNFMKIDTSTIIASAIEISMLVIGITRYIAYNKRRKIVEPT